MKRILFWVWALAAIAMPSQFAQAQLALTDQESPKLDSYTYRGQTITKARFDQLFASHGKQLYSHEKEIYKFPGKRGDGVGWLPTAPNMGDHGWFGGRVLNVLSDGILIINGTVVYKVHGNIPRGIVDGMYLDDFFMIRTGSFSYSTAGGSRAMVADLEAMYPVTRDEFQNYLASGAVLTETRQVSSKCPKCKGSGTIMNPSRRSLNTVPCPDCGGSGKTKPKNIEVEVNP